MVANYPDLKLYIAGEWRQADGQPVINPADESTLATVPHASRADLDGRAGCRRTGIQNVVAHRTCQAGRDHPQGHAPHA